MSSRLTVAFLGLQHPHVFPRLALCLEAADVAVVGVYDRDPELARTVAEDHGVARVARAEDLFVAGPVDLVVIEGLDPENPGYVELAAAHARAVLIEKPGAPTLAAMEAMVRTIRATGVQAQFGYMYSYSPVVERMRAIVAGGVLGPITLARFHAGAPVGGAAELWQSLPEDMGGVLYTDGCHMLAVLVDLLGAPESVTGRILKIADGAEIEADIFKADTLSGLGEPTMLRIGAQRHEDVGAGILVYPDKLATFDVTGWEAHNWVEAWSIEVFGANGTLRATLVPPSFRLWVRRAAPGYEPGWHEWTGSGAATGPGASLVVDENYRAEMDDVLARLRDGRELDPRHVERALEVVRIADAIYGSARGMSVSPSRGS